MTLQSSLPPVQIPGVAKKHAPLALGCWTFGPDQWMGKEDPNLLAAMETSLECGISLYSGKTSSERSSIQNTALNIATIYAALAHT